mmetsp:Transcript_2741/g.5849  ORF Transcript_2741/g.5849 Transcript_2741/m.5849 type:complete len:224 (+) Transcript_2741:695-1366(+)
MRLSRYSSRICAIVVGLTSVSSSSRSSITISVDAALAGVIFPSATFSLDTAPFSSMSGSSSSSSFFMFNISISSWQSSSISFLSSASSGSSSSLKTSCAFLVFVLLPSSPVSSDFRISSSSPSSISRSNAIPIPSFPSTNSPKSRNFFSMSFQRTSSNVPFPMKYRHRTRACCPIRWHRSSACIIIAGVQNNSVNQTVEAAVSVTATPAAVIPNMAILMVGSV